MTFEERCLQIMKEEDISQKLILNKKTSDGMCLKDDMYVGIKKPEFAFALFLHELAHAIQLKRHGEKGHDAIYADILTKLVSIYCSDKHKVKALADSIKGWWKDQDGE